MHDEESKIPSVAKALFRGDLSASVAIPYPTLSPDQQEMMNILVDSVRRFAKDAIDARKIDEEGSIPAAVLDGLKQMGIFGAIIPEEYGGGGLPTTAYAAIAGDITAACASTAITVGAHQSIGMKAIMRFGSEEQKQKYLPKLATGEWLAAFALTEPTSGSDAASIHTRAELSADGTHYVLNGAKQWITNGSLAKIFTVFAVTGKDAKGRNEMTAFIVDRDTPGFNVGKDEHKMGIRGSVTNAIQFENVKVPKENVIWEVGKGFQIAVNVLNEGRLGLGAGSTGAAKALIDMSIAHAKSREQFGHKIADFEMIKHKITDMMVQTFASESMVFFTTGLVDKGMKDFSIEAAMCKVLGTEVLWSVVNHAVQINGGNGFVSEYPYERMLRDSRINIIFEGTNEILRMYIALTGSREVGETLKELGDAMKHPMDSLGVLSSFAVKRVKETIGVDPRPKLEVHAELQNEAALLSEGVHDFGKAVEAALMKYGKKIVEREFVQERISNSAIDLYTMLAVISRVHTDLAVQGKEACTRELHLARLFCRQAAERVDAALLALDKNDDDLVGKISDEAVSTGGYGLSLT